MKKCDFEIKRYRFYIEKDKFIVKFKQRGDKEHRLVFDIQDLEKIKETADKKGMRVRDGYLYTCDARSSRVSQEILGGYANNIFYKNRDKLDLRRENLVTKLSEIDGYIEKKRERFKEQDTEYMIEQMRLKRYNKGYSVKLSEKQASENNNQAKLSYEDVIEIRKIYEESTISQDGLAHKYGVARTCIADIVNYRTWTMRENTNIRKYKNCGKLRLRRKDTRLYESMIGSEGRLTVGERKVYVEKLPIDRLVYIEVHKGGKVELSVDLFYPHRNRDRLKGKEYIVAGYTPRKMRAQEVNDILGEIMKFIRRL